MFKISKIKLDIVGFNTSQSATKHFGFIIPFSTGLNIISGSNTSGKSTILSCIYYGLCLEQLLGSKDLGALNPALKEELEYKGVNYNVLSSTVYIEINNGTKVQTLKRDIKGNNVDTNKIKIFDASISENYSGIKESIKYITLHRDHESDNGFYKWIADFIGIDIPYVYKFGVTKSMTPLYLQTIFPAFFIEQTKGWSDFFATCPNWGIKNNKEKTIEFILGLKQLSLDLKIEELEYREKQIKRQWKDVYDTIYLYATSNFGKINNLTKQPLENEKEINDVTLLVKQNEEEEECIDLIHLIDNVQKEYDDLLSKPLKKTSEVKDFLRKEFLDKTKLYQGYKQKYNDFILDFNSQELQLICYKEQEGKIDQEKKDNQDIIKILEDHGNNPDYKICPTCNQNIVNSLRDKRLQVKEMPVNENIKYLDNQLKLLQGSIKGLNKTLKEKQVIKQYFIKEMSLKEQELKIIQDELISHDNYPSATEVFKRIKLEVKLTDLKNLKINFSDLIGELKHISKRFSQLNIDKDNLDLEVKDDNVKLNHFRTSFVHYLKSFGYSTITNYLKIDIQKEYPFKYLPVLNYEKPQKITIGSSASDGIRAIWAYYLSLLVEGVNHFGVVLFDEPGQHKMNQNSLKRLFEKASEIKDKQVIISTSVDTILEDKNKIDLIYLLDGLVENKDYKHYKIETDKSIHEL